METTNKEPKLNVLSRDVFLDRTRKIFDLYSNVLSKTLGAYGSPTIISNYPMIHVTKDGFTVCRNIEVDNKNSEMIDKTISLMAMNICSRLNYSVGDGTTTAIVSTNEIYKYLYALMEADKSLEKVRPKDLLKTFNEIKDELVEKLKEKSTLVTQDNATDVIRKIVHVSSNGDDKLTNMITEAYEKLGYPRIECVESDTDETYMEIINGFDTKVFLGDKIYINNDEKTANCKNCDVILFDHKVKLETYTEIIRPLCGLIRQMGRHLICIAPAYDDVVLNGVIKRELLTELEKTKDICLVLTAIQLNNAFAKKSYNDLAVVLGTTIIDRSLEADIIDKIDEVGDIRNVFDMSDREIPGIAIFPSKEYSVEASQAKVYDEDRKSNCLVRLGFTEEASIGMTKSVFKNSFYNEEVYNACLKEAEMDLKEVIDKFAILGTYTRDVYEAQKRLASIRMKMAKIYVGGDSDISKNLLKDSVDDSIRAAESAFQNGYIQGCNLTLIQSIYELIDNEEEGTVRNCILVALKNAFESVYRKVMSNAFGDNIEIRINSVRELQEDLTCYGIKIDDNEMLEKIVNKYTPGTYANIVDIILQISLTTGKVLNLDNFEFSNDVINSSKTDIEVLTATSDLLSMLMVGNQVVLASYNHMRAM